MSPRLQIIKLKIALSIVLIFGLSSCSFLFNSMVSELASEIEYAFLDIESIEEDSCIGYIMASIGFYSENKSQFPNYIGEALVLYEGDTLYSIETNGGLELLDEVLIIDTLESIAIPKHCYCKFDSVSLTRTYLDSIDVLFVGTLRSDSVIQTFNNTQRLYMEGDSAFTFNSVHLQLYQDGKKYLEME